MASPHRQTSLSRFNSAMRFISPEEAITPAKHTGALCVKLPADIVWHDVHAVLSEEHIKCFKATASAAANPENRLAAVPLINPTSRQLPQRTSAYKPKRPYTFCVRTAHGPYFFACSSEPDLQQWLDKLEVWTSQLQRTCDSGYLAGEYHQATCQL